MEKEKDPKTTRAEFSKLVNMTPSALTKWLDTEESKSVGQDSGDGTSIGAKSGHRILDIKKKKAADLTEDDFHHMHRVISYISRHLAQGPSKHQVEDSPWRYSLMNWGHDPLKDGRKMATFKGRSTSKKTKSGKA